MRFGQIPGEEMIDGMPQPDFERCRREGGEIVDGPPPGQADAGFSVMYCDWPDGTSCYMGDFLNGTCAAPVQPELPPELPAETGFKVPWKGIALFGIGGFAGFWAMSGKGKRHSVGAGLFGAGLLTIPVVLHAYMKHRKGLPSA